MLHLRTELAAVCACMYVGILAQGKESFECKTSTLFVIAVKRCAFSVYSYSA